MPSEFKAVPAPWKMVLVGRQWERRLQGELEGVLMPGLHPMGGESLKDLEFSYHRLLSSIGFPLPWQESEDSPILSTTHRLVRSWA